MLEFLNEANATLLRMSIRQQSASQFLDNDLKTVIEPD